MGARGKTVLGLLTVLALALACASAKPNPKSG
jgi:hypothetical protein